MRAPDARCTLVALEANWPDGTSERTEYVPASALEQMRAEVADARRELEVMRENGVNTLRLSVDEVRDPLYALGIAKHDLAALRQTATRLARALGPCMCQQSGGSHGAPQIHKCTRCVLLSDPLVAELLEGGRDVHD